MKILITNDDGIHAYGIQILANGLRGLGEVYVAAHNPIRVAQGMD